jgi:hypothetical protein
MAKAAVKSSESEKTANTRLYLCLVPVKHDGVAYEVGDKVDLAENQARALLACKAIEEVEPSAKVKGNEK